MDLNRYSESLTSFGREVESFPAPFNNPPTNVFEGKGGCRFFTASEDGLITVALEDITQSIEIQVFKGYNIINITNLQAAPATMRLEFYQ